MRFGAVAGERSALRIECPGLSSVSPTPCWSRATAGGLVAICMGPRTANPDRVYFASGSFEREDFPGGRLDVDFNMAREVRE